MYIDIHNHILHGVDDGARTLEEALAMLQEQAQQGAQALILTPHYRHGMFPYDRETIQKNYLQLSEQGKAIGIPLYLGCEYHVNSDIITAFGSGRCRTLAGSDYVLTEYHHETEYTYIMRNTQQLLSCGYLPIIAHAERYACLTKKPKLCMELQKIGARIQLSADSVLGLDGKHTERVCRKMIQHGWADIIASDAHGIRQRPCRMKECYLLVAQKYGEEYARELFYKTPLKIITEAGLRS